MGMRKRIAKGVGYAVAPKATFTALHPRKAAYAKATTWLVDRMTPSRRRRSRTRAVATGLGAAAVTVPLGLWLGRRIRSQRHQSGEFDNA
jgi:hypothetical protein